MKNYRFNVRQTKEKEAIGPKTRFLCNMEAIKTLKKCIAENREATEQEQEILAQYMGWGGASDAFDKNKENWAAEYAALKEILSEEAYAEASESTLDSFYTPYEVVANIYNYLVSTGFKQGNLLEPSCGTGMFFGMIPEVLEDVKLFGVEVDSISSQIAQKLYPNARIQHAKFEDANIEHDFFDVVVGNCPFGEWTIKDKSLSNQSFFVHDYFLIKSIAAVRPGGLVIMVTSKGSLDKKDCQARKYLAERAELIGAIRLPEITFKNAGTRAITDILFLRKREHLCYEMPSWVETVVNTDGFEINSYFAEHPEQIVGELQEVSGPYGSQVTCIQTDRDAYYHKLAGATQRIPVIPYTIFNMEEDDEQENQDDFIVANPLVKNFSFTLVSDEIYFRENSIMKRQQLGTKATERVTKLIKLRDQLKHLINIQLIDTTTEAEIKANQKTLNSMYDAFIEQFGTIGNSLNSRYFSKDESYYLLCSLETLDEDKELVEKAAIFTERTINPYKRATHAKTAYDAMIICRNELGKLDIATIATLCGKDSNTVIKELKNVIFKVPYLKDEDGNDVYEIAEEYLSGNIREKLKIAQSIAESDASFQINVDALKKNVPDDLEASEIFVQLGSTWVDTEIFQDFFYEIFEISPNRKRFIKLVHDPVFNMYKLEGIAYLPEDVLATSTYGTTRISGYQLFEKAMNLKDAKVYDTVEDAEGNSRRVVNMNETIVATQKMDLIKQAFKDWIFDDLDRRTKLVRYYNDTYNAIKPREYNGDHLIFPGMNPNIELRKHQKDAIARVLYGGNTILCHAVGAGKTFEIVAAVMESKRIGLSDKALIVVPNHLTEQWGTEFLRLYPQADILVATKKDFTKKNRKKFCTKISLGSYDAVIIGHGQFEKIPLSKEREERALRDEVASIVASIEEQSNNALTVKGLKRQKRILENKLAKLTDREQDQVITFEELGITMLCVDEAHYYKNAFVYTKMHNVSGVSQTQSQRAMDMVNKCHYMDEITNHRGIVFATGTPISNTMSELFVMQKYLQNDVLEKYHIHSFDAWASMYAETVTSLELTPEGSGFRPKTRLARFNNIPELMNIFKLTADIKVAKQLNLPTPHAIYKTLATESSDTQKDILSLLAQRADRVHKKMVDPTVDNMLTITNDGRKLALDQRVMDADLVDCPISKVNTCVEKVYDIWKFTAPQRCAQIIFCDLSTPKKDGIFNVYDDVKNKLILKGVPANEIAFIHDAKSDKDKDILFQRVRSGDVRVILGSTEKLGAGTNIQTRLVALHHLDIGWRPSDLEQREGRIIRQGNLCKDVWIYRYITTDTFDSFMWQTVEKKQQFISQIMTEKSPVRSCEDIDETVLDYAEIKALATGNPLIKEQMELEVEVDRLKLLEASYKNTRYKLEELVGQTYPMQISMIENTIENLVKDGQFHAQYMNSHDNQFSVVIRDTRYDEPKEAAKAIQAVFSYANTFRVEHFGTYCGFDLSAEYNTFNSCWTVNLKRQANTRTDWKKIGAGNFRSFDVALNRFAERQRNMERKLQGIKAKLQQATKALDQPFEFVDELRTKEQRLQAVSLQLNLDKAEAENA